MIYNLSSLLSKIQADRIYTGREEGCRCGCNGNYFERGSRGYTRAANKAFAIDPQIIIFDSASMPQNEISYKVSSLRFSVLYGEKPIVGFAVVNSLKHINFVDIILPGNKTITFYMD